MITKIGTEIHELGYKDSWKAKMQKAKRTPLSYVAGHSLASGIHSGLHGGVGAVLAAMALGKSPSMKARFLNGMRMARVAAPAAAASAMATGVVDAPLEYSYTQGIMPSENPFKAMLGYTRVTNSVKNSVK